MKKVRETATAEEVIKSLPGLLKERPELRWEIYRIISDEFVRRDEFYEYMKRSDERFEAMGEEGDYHIGEASILCKVLRTNGYRGWIEWQEPAERYEIKTNLTERYKRVVRIENDTIASTSGLNSLS